MTAPWSPSRAREAARAALCRYLHEEPGYMPMIRLLRSLLANDRAFDSADAMLRASPVVVVEARELRALLEDG